MIFLSKLKFFIQRAYLSDHFPSFFEVLFSRKKRLVYYGFLGDGNFGDELVFMATKKLFSDCLIIPHKRHMPIFTKLYCQLFSDSIAGMIVGGGTLIRGFNADRTFYKKLLAKDKPVFFHGTGVDPDLMDKALWPLFFENANFGGVRGPQSQLFLRNSGFNFKQIGDAALYLNDNFEHIKKKKRIILNFGTHRIIEDLDHSRSHIIKFIKSLDPSNYKIAYMPFHLIDQELGKALKSEIDDLEILDVAETYDSVLEIMAEAEFCIGERLHFIVMSILAKTNFVSINYDQKHVDFLKSLDLENFGYDPKDIDSQVIERVFKKQGEVINWSEVNTKIESFKIINNSEKGSFINRTLKK